jgi:hypothetical protein
MVWRDLDLTVVCRGFDAEAVAGAGASLAGHPRVREVRFIDDTGDWNTDPTYPNGLYLGLRCRSLAGEIWKVDIPGARPGLGSSVMMSGSSEADPEGGQGLVWVAGVAAQRGGDVDRSRRLSTPMARLRRQAMTVGVGMAAQARSAQPQHQLNGHRADHEGGQRGQDLAEVQEHPTVFALRSTRIV